MVPESEAGVSVNGSPSAGEGPSGSAGAAIRVAGARKVYEGGIGHPAREAVRDVSFEVAPGEIHGLLGPNGAGKTTTLKMLLGLVRPTAGTFEVLGQKSNTPQGRVGLGFLPESPYFAPQLTAGQAMRLFGRLVGLPPSQIAEQTERLLSDVGLQGRTSTQLSKFSRGMLQRLGIAQALLGRPRVLVLDEPASGLDPVGQRDVRNLMLRLRDDGVTILLSSHQLSEAETVCDRVTILVSGRVGATGRLDDLLNVAGQVSVRIRGLNDGLPTALDAVVTDVAASGGAWIVSVADSDVRRVVDAVDDVGGIVEALVPKRESLEDYFTHLLEIAGAGDDAAEGGA